MNRHVLSAAALALVSALVATAPVAHAQMAGALGKPLPAPSLSAGTVTVRVIAGAPDKPLVGIDVKLEAPDGKSLTARTDGEGRATFSNLTPGARYTAKASEPADDTSSDEPKQAASDQFTVPQSGGIRLMISTRGWQGAGGAMGAGAAGPMAGMDPRQMSGIPRGDPVVPARRMTVAVVRKAVTNRLPDRQVHLIGYAADGTVTRESKMTGADGRAEFSDLIPMDHAYYVITTFERGQGQGADRVISDPITMPPRVGIRLLLAGTPDKSQEPPVDDMPYLGQQGDRVKPGEVLAQFWYQDQATAPKNVSLYEIPEGDGAPVAVATVPLSQPKPADVTADFQPVTPAPQRPAGVLSMTVVYAGQQAQGLPGVVVSLEPITPAADSSAGSTPAENAAHESPRLTTDESGTVQFTNLSANQTYRPVVELLGERHPGNPIVIPAGTGVEMRVVMNWRFTSSAEARFVGVPADKLYFVQTDKQEMIQRTRPFPMVADRGAIVGLPLYSKPLFSFHFAGWVDDEYMGFQGQIAVLNMSPLPWNPGPNGLEMPLPAGFVGGRVDDEVADRVKVEPSKGFLWRGLMPPGRQTFRVGYSLPVHEGSVDFDMNLPIGVFQGSIVLIKNPGMKLINVPRQLNPFERQARDGRDIIELGNIRYQSGGKLGFGITGLPQRSKITTYVSWLIGGLVLILIGWALFHVFSSRSSAMVVANGRVGTARAADRSRLRKLSKQREDLLEELVALESKKRGKQIADAVYKQARGKLQTRLEAVYKDIEKLESELGSS